MRARLVGIAALLMSGSLLATTGCLGGGAQTRFYVLAPLAGAVATAADSRPVTIGVGPVRLPGYIDRAPLVTRRGAEEIDVADLDRWGEPLADGVPGLDFSFAGLKTALLYKVRDLVYRDAEKHAEYIRLVSDLMVLAFQTDTTRICTFMLANGGSFRTLEEIGAQDARTK